MGDGWGVVVQTQPKAPAQRKGAAAGVKPKAKRSATPYVDIKSETGLLGMTLLQRKLANDGELMTNAQACHCSHLSGKQDTVFDISLEELY